MHRRSSRTTTRCFIRNGVRALFESAVDHLRTEASARGREVQFEVFPRYDLADVRHEAQPTYAELAAALGLTVTMVTNHLAAMRRTLRARVLERLRELTASDDDSRPRPSGCSVCSDERPRRRRRGPAARRRHVPDLGERDEMREPNRPRRIQRRL